MSSPTRNQQVITHETASKLVARAVSHAADNGWSVAVVAVDPWGAVVAAARMDGVPAPVYDIAADKAYTAVLGRTTRAFNERMASGPDMQLGLLNRPRLCAWEGGVPIRVDGQLAGALGISGATAPEDAACAEHALAILETR